MNSHGIPIFGPLFDEPTRSFIALWGVIALNFIVLGAVFIYTPWISKTVTRARRADGFPQFRILIINATTMAASGFGFFGHGPVLDHWVWLAIFVPTTITCLAIAVLWWPTYPDSAGDGSGYPPITWP